MIYENNLINSYYEFPYTFIILVKNTHKEKENILQEKINNNHTHTHRNNTDKKIKKNHSLTIGITSNVTFIYYKNENENELLKISSINSNFLKDSPYLNFKNNFIIKNRDYLSRISELFNIITLKLSSKEEDKLNYLIDYTKENLYTLNRYNKNFTTHIKKEESLFVTISIYNECEYFVLKDIIIRMLFTIGLLKSTIDNLDSYIITLLNREDIVKTKSDHRKFYIGIKLNLIEWNVKLFISKPIINRKYSILMNENIYTLSIKYLNITEDINFKGFLYN